MLKMKQVAHFVNIKSCGQCGVGRLIPRSQGNANSESIVGLLPLFLFSLESLDHTVLQNTLLLAHFMLVQPPMNYVIYSEFLGKEAVQETKHKKRSMISLKGLSGQTERSIMFIMTVD